MISFNVRCGKDHVFEAWFKDGKSFDRQARQGKVMCPSCGDTTVEKAPMAPNVASGVSRKSDDGAQKKAREFNKMLGKLRGEIEKNCDYVGSEFAEEARKMHYDEVEKRNIYGEASDEESKELSEEGIDFLKVPWPERTNS